MRHPPQLTHCPSPRVGLPSEPFHRISAAARAFAPGPERISRRWKTHQLRGSIPRTHDLGSLGRLPASKNSRPYEFRLDFLTIGSRSAHRASAALLISSPLTTDRSTWYAGDGLAYALMLAGLSVDGFIVSLGGQRLFGRWLFEDG